jgi:hypothetical protein
MSGIKYKSQIDMSVVPSEDKHLIRKKDMKEYTAPLTHVGKGGIRAHPLARADKEGFFNPKFDFEAWPMMKGYIIKTETTGNLTAETLYKVGSGWTAVGGGVDGTIRAMTFDADGNLYVGGKFVTAGGVTVNNVAKWDGSSWSAFGNGIGTKGNGVTALEFDPQGNLYAGGHSLTVAGTSDNILAIWDGLTWSTPINSITTVSGRPTINALSYINNRLYLGGYFASINGVAIKNIMEYNGTLFSQSGNGANDIVYCIKQASSILYAGCKVGGLLKLAGGTWSVYDNTNGIAYGLALDSSEALYSGGNGVKKVGYDTNYGTFNNLVQSLCIDQSNNLFAGGTFSTISGSTVNRIAKWDGTSWSALDGGVNNDVYVIAFDGASALYVGGSFTSAGGVPTVGIAKYEWDQTIATLNTTTNADGSIIEVYTSGAYTATKQPTFNGNQITEVIT